MKKIRRTISLVLVMGTILSSVFIGGTTVSAETGWNRIVYQINEQTTSSGNHIIWDLPDMKSGRLRITYDIKGEPKFANEELALINTSGETFGIVQHGKLCLHTSFLNGVAGKSYLTKELKEGEWVSVEVIVDLNKDDVEYSVKNMDGKELVKDKGGTRQRYNTDLDSIVLWSWTDTKVTRRNFSIEIEEELYDVFAQETGWVNRVSFANNEKGVAWIDPPKKIHMPETITHGKVRIGYEFRRGDGDRDKGYTRVVDATGKEIDGRGSIMSVGSSFSVGDTTAPVTLLETVPRDEFKKFEAIIDLDAKKITYYVKELSGELIGFFTRPYSGQGFTGVNVYNWDDMAPYVRNYKIDVLGQEGEMSPPKTDEGDALKVKATSITDATVGEDGKVSAAYNATNGYAFVVGCYNDKRKLVWCNTVKDESASGEVAPEIVVPEEYRDAQIKAYFWNNIWN